MSIEIYYHDNFVFGHIFLPLTSILLIFAFCVLTWSANSKKPMESRTMVCCSYVGIFFGVEHHHMPDRVLGLAHEGLQQLVSRSWADLGGAWRSYPKGFRG